MTYQNFSIDFQKQWTLDKERGITNPYATPNAAVIRRNMNRDMSQRLHRPPFQRDIEKILHIPPYNRYAGKTQVFSFEKNDDISKRGLHVQLVARTARTISRMLHLNEDLTEAIALGHDLGHTPFGHAGEHILNNIYFKASGRYFNHNIHSVRILDELYSRNVSLQTLDGIACHNGESSQKVFTTSSIDSFEKFDVMIESCYQDEQAIGHLRPATLEGCVVRISDMIAYVGKDRQDALKVGMQAEAKDFDGGTIGTQNAEIINNLVVDIVEHSYMKNHIEMSDNAFKSLKTAKAENYEKIYLSHEQSRIYDNAIAPMFEELFEVVVSDIQHRNATAPVFSHFINKIDAQNFEHNKEPLLKRSDAATIATDYLASMTDDYFLAAHRFMCPESSYTIPFKGYFDE
ncbi:MAG: HD domain-containing protein [Eggerthellaceae bacterium]|nr:HD domain-containing protein [Eggerthellaceae bacterium]